METARIVGRIVGWTERSYQAFTTGSGENVPAGTTRTVWVVGEDCGEPAEVRVPSGEEYNALVSAGFGGVVHLEVELRAQGNRIKRRLTNVVEVRRLTKAS